jgi:N-acetylmuramoyl-L-alanine amidase
MPALFQRCALALLPAGLATLLCGCAGTLERHPGFTVDTAHHAVGQDARVRFLVMHYTALDLQHSRSVLTTETVSAHYLVPAHPRISGGRPVVERLVPESRRAWHAGDSFWQGESELNSASIGIENVNLGPLPDVPDVAQGLAPGTTQEATKGTTRGTTQGTTQGPTQETPQSTVQAMAQGTSQDTAQEISQATSQETLQSVGPVPTRWQPYPPEQVAALVALSRDLVARYAIAPTRVVGHSDIAPQRKEDPGPLFPWLALAQAGVGAWPDAGTASRYLAGRDPHAIVPVAGLQRRLAEYGYRVATDGVLDEPTRRVFAAFQMHFRAADYSGAPDAQTEAIADALLEKYFGYASGTGGSR